MTTYALIDKYAIIRTGIGLFLKTQFDQINILESESILGMQKQNPDQLPDLIILGISQGTGAQNINLIKIAKKTYPDAKIILYDEVAPGKTLSIVLSYMREGVSGYVTKFNDLSDFVDCVRKVLNGKKYICSEVYDLLIYNNPDQSPDLTNMSILTSREYEIASYLVEGLSTNKIAAKIGRKATTISTIKNNIFKKLEIDNIMKLYGLFHPVHKTATY